MAHSNFERKQMAVLVAGACLIMTQASANGSSCPVSSGGIITVDNVTVTNTCTAGSGDSVVVTATGKITVPVASTPNNGIQVNAGVTAA